MSFQEKEFSLAEFEPVRKEVLDSFFKSIENEAIRHLCLNLFNATDGKDHETYFGLLRFMCFLGRPTGHDQGKLADLSILKELPSVLTQRITRFRLCPLHIAVMMGHTELIEALVEAAKSSEDKDLISAVLNATDEYGNTPLYFAVAFRHREICRYLIEHGADADQKNDLDGSPSDLAHRLYAIDMVDEKASKEPPVPLWIKRQDSEEAVLVSELDAQAECKLPITVRARSAMSWRVLNALYLCGLRPTQTHMSPRLHREFQEAFGDAVKSVSEKLFLAATSYDDGRPLPDKGGWGLYAKEDLPIGLLVPYGGMLRLAQFMDSGDRNFLLATAQHPVLKQCAYEGMIHSHLGSFVNHSFPNCAYVHGFWKGTVELAIMVTEPIKAGEQLTVSYGLSAEKKGQFEELRPNARRSFIEDSFETSLSETLALIGSGDANDFSWKEHCRVLGLTAKFLYLHGRKLAHGDDDFTAHPRFMSLIQD